MKANRIGKIARLPRSVREKLNARIEDGEPAGVLLEWLNSLPVTQRIVEDYFEGRLITEQNLSVWRQGGFVEWQRNQERRALLREFLSEAEELEEEVLGEEENGEPLTDRLAEVVALELAVLLREAMAEERGPERTKAILEIARELGRLRRGDHQRRRVVLEEKKWERELDEKFEAECEEIRRKTEWENLRTKVEAEQARERYEREQKAGTLNPQWAAKVEGFFATHGEQLRKLGVAELPVDNRPPEQRQPQPSPQGQDGVRYGTGGLNHHIAAPVDGSIPQSAAQGESK